MSQEAVTVLAPDDVWHVVPVGTKTTVYPGVDVTLPFAAGDGVIKALVPLKALPGLARYIDLTSGAPYLIVGTANGTAGWLVPEAQFATIDSLLSGAGVSGNWAPIHRISRTHHVDNQQF